MRSILVVLATVLTGAIGLASPADGAARTGTASGWVAQSPALPRMTFSQLHGVSCSDSSDCAAVGFAETSAGNVSTVAEAWNGAGWVDQFVPSPGPAALLEGVSCSAVSTCTAVGSSIGRPLVLRETGGSFWSQEAAPLPSGGSSPLLAGISCPALTACTAVGSYVDSSGVRAILAEQWDGSNWTIEATPIPAGATDAGLGSVSCTSPSACIAVGEYSTSTFTMNALAEAWNGSSWSVLTTPNPTGANNDSLTGVSCTSSTICEAVGSYSDSAGSNHPLAERWHAGTWTIQVTPDPSGATSSSLSGVSCKRSSACVAVGFSQVAGTDTSVSEIWNGASWTVNSMPAPAGAASWLDSAVSCTGAQTCTAVGSQSGGAMTRGLVDRLHSGVWSVQKVPNAVVVKGVDLYGVACPSLSSCMAVGDFYNGGSSAIVLVESWNGKRWTVSSVPAPSGDDSTLLAVSCASPSSCTAVGSMTTNVATSATRAIVESWNGAQWQLQLPPQPTRAKSSSLAGVSCSSATDCMAVGTVTDQLGTHGYAEQFNGTAWAPEAVPIPAGATTSQLNSVSCPGTTLCMAVGFYQNGSGNYTTFGDSWDGTVWSLQNTLGSPDTNSSLLFGVSCASSTMCTAVGRAFDPQSEFLIEGWDGTTWSLQNPDVPSGSSNPNLSGISCSAANSCEAVGSYLDASSQGQTLAEVWNGATWLAQATPTATGSTFPGLSQVSCTTPIACVAVGTAPGAPNPALIYRYTG